MKFVRHIAALLAWIVIYIPTTLFVVLVMIKEWFRLRRERKHNPRRQEVTA